MERFSNFRTACESNKFFWKLQSTGKCAVRIPSFSDKKLLVHIAPDQVIIDEDMAGDHEAERMSDVRPHPVNFPRNIQLALEGARDQAGRFRLRDRFPVEDQ